MEPTESVETTEAKVESENPALSDEQKTGDVAAAAEKPQQSRRDRRAERRINKLTARNGELAEANQQLKSQIDELSTKVDDLAKPKPVRPQRDDFETDEAYEDALLDFGYNQRKPVEAKPDPTPEGVPDAEKAKKFMAFIESGKEVLPQFDTIVNKASFPLTEHALEDLMEMGEDGAELFDYLDKNPAEALRISQLSNRDQSTELEKLADSLDEKSSAPEPIKPLESGDHPTVDVSKLTPEQRIRRRQEEIRKRRPR